MQRYDSKPQGLATSARARAGYLCATAALVLCMAWPSGVATAGGPTGGTVAAGSATISNPNANTTNINQTSEKVIINWQNFSIPSDSAVNFSQPDAAAIALNRVTGTDISSIEGALNANGNVWIINANGILFGKGAEINVGSLIATSADISDSDFMNGQYNFTKAGNPNAAIGNEGTIRAADGGSVVLAGPVVSNNGLIEADLGSVTLAGTQAFTVDFQGDNLIRFTMTAPQSGAGTPDKLSVSNAGKISANGGHVLMTVRAAESVADSVINNTGMVEANTVRNENGTIVLDAGDGEADVSGTLAASGKDAGQTGGSVSVTGQTVAVAGNAKIDASGSAGGGTIAIGGNLHGAGPTPNAQTTTVGKATLSADATGDGNGGTISVWSDQSTQFAGSASARGAGHGNGGLVETSGGNLQVGDSAAVDTSAPHGLTGNWLLDPSYISIDSGGSDGTGCANTFCTIAPGTITGALSTTDVTLQATNDIDVYSDISYTSAHTLNLLAGGDIYVAANVQNSGTGAINVVAGWDGTTTNTALFGNAGVYGNIGGSIYVTSDYDLDPDEAYSSEAEEGEAHAVAVGSAGGATTVAGYDVQVLGSFGNSQIGYQGTGGGAINVYALGGVTLTGGGCSNCYAQIGNGGIGYNGVMSGAVSVHAGGDVTLTSGASVYSYAQIGDGGDSSAGNAGGGVLVDAGGAVNLYGGGDYAQIGNGGWAFNGDSSGMVTVDAGGGVTLTGGSATPYGYTQIGNGGQSSHGNSSGDVLVESGGAITLASEADSENYALIGNGGFANIGNSVSGNASGNVTLWAQDNLQFDVCGGENCSSQGTVWVGNAAPSGVVSGNLTIIAADQKDNCGDNNCNADVGTMIMSALGDDTNGNYIDGAGGNVTVAFTDPQHNDAPQLNIDAGISYDTPFDLTIVSGNNITISGSLQNAGNGDLTLVAGWNPDEVTPENIIAQAGADASMAALFTANPAAYGVNSGTILIGGPNACQNVEGDCGSAVGSAGGTTSIFSGDVTVEADNGTARIGYHGAGGGAIDVFATNNVNVTGNDGQHAVIGNGGGDIAANVTGDIDVRAANQLQLYANNNGTAWIGNTAQTGHVATGNVSVIAGSEDDNFDIGTIIQADLGDDTSGHYIEGAGGNVTFGFTNLAGNQKIDHGAEYDSPHTLSILSSAGLDISGSLLNDGAGAINIVAGWNPAIVTPDQVVAATEGADGAMAALFAAHASAYGNGGATVTIGGAQQLQDPSVGSAGGTTTVFTGNLMLDAGGDVAQLGHPDGSGDIAVYAKDTIALTGASADALAIIGNGTTASPGGGDITLTAQAMTVNAYNAVLGDTAFITITGTNGIGDLADPLRLWLNSVAITTAGGGVAATSPGGGISIGVGANGINLNGGALTLSAAGAISQTQAILASAIDVSTTSGAITLSNSSNSFGTLTVATSGSDDATIYDSSAVTVASANVGGTFALTSAGSIGQSGAIVAHALSATSTSGTITLNHSGNSFSTLTVSTSASNNASVNDSTGVSVTSANVGGTFTLTSGGAIGQSGAIVANAFSVSSTNGAITLNTAGNSFATLAVATSASNNASLNDTASVTVASANAGGTFTLTSGGAIGQSGVVIANALNVSSTGGTITLTNSGNSFGTLTVGTGSSYDANIYDSTAVTVVSANVGGTFTLASVGAIGQSGAIVANAFSVSSTGGAITLNTAGNSFGTLAVATSASNNASLNDTASVTVASANAGGTFTLTSGGAINQSGAIVANALNVSSTGGAIALNNSGNAFATLSVATAGSNNASVNDSTGVIVASAHVGGTFTLTSGGPIGQNDPIIANALNVTSTGGAITLDDPGNAFAALTLASGANSATVYDTVDLIVNGAAANGGLTLLTKGNLTFVNSVQVAGGNLLAVAGWDGTTVNSATVTTGNAYGNNAASIVIGGAGAAGNVAVGASGAATLAASNITLSAVNGYAQFGIHGSGAGPLAAIAKGNIALNAGSATGESAQIGNGGYQATGSNGGTIAIAAAGDVNLAGGSGTDAYAQIGHGGGQSNANSAGYGDTGAITITAGNFNLSGGSGSGAYAQAGNGGYRAGAGLTGTGTISGAIAVTVSHNVNLSGGGGANAFAQIGNGGGFANTNATASANGVTSGDIVVTAPNGSSGGVSVGAGAGGNAYAQIGNGGYSSNSPSAASHGSFVISGNVTVTDLVMTGGGGGANAYSQIGNGDIGHASVGDIFGNIVIDTSGGSITLVQGTAPDSFALIQNATGSGTVSGTISGYIPPQSEANGTIASLTGSQTPSVPTDTTADTVVLQEEQQQTGTSGTSETGAGQGPLEDLTDNSGQGTQDSSDKSDKAADALGDSLDGSKKKSASEVYFGGLVTKLEPATASNTPHGIPPADADFASWGNEAFWQ
jgi:filamentous hemagglutinin family protein